MKEILNEFLATWRRLFPKLIIPLAVGSAFLGAFSIGVGIYFFFHHPEVSELPMELPIQEETTSTLSGQLKTIEVDVSGGVQRPGLIALEEGLRIGDAIASAGGFAKNVDLSIVHRKVNLAKKLVDGDKVYIPMIGDESIDIAHTTGVEGEASTRINLNTASLAALQTLKGIGSVRAEAIIGHRPYTSLEDLQQKTGIPRSVVEEISPQAEL